MWNRCEGGNASAEVIRSLRRKVHQTLRSVTRDFEQFEFNTIVSGLMELMNEMQKAKQQGAWGTPAWNEAVDIYLRMLARLHRISLKNCGPAWASPFRSIPRPGQRWMKPRLRDEITLVVQVNGKVRDRIRGAGRYQRGGCQGCGVGQ